MIQKNLKNKTIINHKKDANKNKIKQKNKESDVLVTIGLTEFNQCHIKKISIVNNNIKKRKKEEIVNMEELLKEDIKNNIIDMFYEKLIKIIQKGNRNEELEKYLERYPDRLNVYGFFPCKGSKAVYFKPCVKNAFEELIRIAGFKKLPKEESILKKMKKCIVK